MDQTKHLPRSTVEDLFAADRACPICAETALTVTHLDELPDYVKCANCGSVFVLDSDSEQVMFGSISDDYPATSRFALKRWLPIEEIRAKAGEERGLRGEPAPGAPAVRPSTAEHEGDPARSAPPFEGEQAEPPGPARPAAAVPSAPGEAAPLEPERGQRFRVIVGAEPELPSDHCAHCYRMPAARHMAVSGDFESARSYELPLCRICHARATARSDEERNSRLVAHLSALLGGAMLFVLTLALANFGLQAPMLVSVALAGFVGALGYGAAALLIVSRPSRFPPPEDATYVQTTVLIQPHRHEDALAFFWRNPRYAELFFKANQQQVKGEITKVFESGRIQTPAMTKR